MTQLSVGHSVSAVVDSEGKLYTWGSRNDHGQLGRDLQGKPRDDASMPNIVEFLEGKVVT